MRIEKTPLEEFTYVGIDPGISPTIAIIPNVYYYYINTEKYADKSLPNWLSEYRRLKSLYDTIPAALGRVNTPLVVGIEKAVLGASFRVGTMSKIEHVLVDIFLPGNIVYLVEATTVKKFITGNGHASKGEVADKLKDFGYSSVGLNDHITDAIAVALYTKELWRQSYYEEDNETSY